MIANQLGRRNLSAKQISYLRGMQQQREKQTVANPDGSNQYIEVKPQNEVQPLENTAARLAKQYGVSKATIERDVEYTNAVDAIVAATAPEVQQQLLGTDSKFMKSATLKLANWLKNNQEHWWIGEIKN
jgi:response regulator of citrate/malate metabolism